MHFFGASGDLSAWESDTGGDLLSAECELIGNEAGGEDRSGLRGGELATFCLALLGRAQRAARLRGDATATAPEISNSDLRFQIEETANANSKTPRARAAHGAPGNANANANEDPSPLKGIRDDSGSGLD